MTSWPRASAAALSLFLGVSGLVGVSACGGQGDRAIPTATVTAGPFDVVLAVPGELEAVNSVTISAPDLGRTIKITSIAEEGSRVSEGDVVVEYDRNELLDDLEQAEGKLEVARTKIAQKKTQLDVRMADLENNVVKAELALERAEMRVSDSETVPLVDRQSARIDVREAQLSLDSSRATLEQERLKAQAELQLLELEVRQEELKVQRSRERLEKATATAPADGLVILPEIWKGGSMGRVQAGDTVWRGSTIMLLPDLSSMQIESWVHEVDAGKVEVGQPVRVVIDAHPEPAWEAEISKVADLAVKRDGDDVVKHVKVEAAMDETADTMKPGMTVRAEVLVDHLDEALSIPQEAVFVQGERTYVYRKAFAGFDDVDVELGIRNDTHVVVASGLEAGDVVALVDPERFEAGEPLPAAQTPSEPDES